LSSLVPHEPVDLYSVPKVDCHALLHMDDPVLGMKHFNKEDLKVHTKKLDAPDASLEDVSNAHPNSMSLCVPATSARVKQSMASKNLSNKSSVTPQQTKRFQTLIKQTKSNDSSLRKKIQPSRKNSSPLSKNTSSVEAFLLNQKSEFIWAPPAPFLNPVHPERVTRAKRNISKPLDDCLLVPGFMDLMQYIGPYSSKLELQTKNNLNAVRSLFKLAEDKGIKELSMNLLANPSLIDSYITEAEHTDSYRPKTILQKIEALKKPLHWLRITSRNTEKAYAQGINPCLFDIIQDTLDERCRKLRPYAKADEGRSATVQYMQAAKQWLSRDDFALLEGHLNSWATFYWELICNQTLKSNAWTQACISYEQVVLTWLFVGIPTPRLKTVANINIEDIKISNGIVYLSIGVEKNSFRHLGLKDAIGRNIFMPETLAVHLQHWILDLLPRFKRVNETTPWINASGRKVQDKVLGTWVRKTCNDICGLKLDPLSLRKLRTTYVIDAIDELDGTVFDKLGLKMEYAHASGHSLDVMLKYYVIKDMAKSIARSKSIIEKTNQGIFGKGGPGMVAENTNFPMFFPEENPAYSVLMKPPSFTLKKITKGHIKKNGTRSALDIPFDSCDLSDLPMVEGHVDVLLTHTFTQPQRSCNAPRPIQHMIAKEEAVQKVLSGEWLSDQEIFWALFLLKKKYVHVGGLEDTVVMAAGQSRCRADETINVYILHTGGNHWVTVCLGRSRGGIRVYDSLALGHVSEDIKEQMRHVTSQNKFHLVPMQQQIDVQSCGLFAIACAVDLIDGFNPCGIQYDESMMREHLACCIRTENILPFPRRMTKATEAIVVIE
jgi:hypothetical protein